ncbi:MAG: LysR family transcriptional regulator, partial [Pseudoruegeria sp.]
MDHLGFLTNYLAVLDAGSLSGGARIQGISQPALSQQIASLEGYYGETLVHRSSSGVSPTRAGTMVAKYATQIQATHRRLLLDLDTLGQSPNGQLDISTGQALAQICIADVVYGLRHSQPDLDLRLHTQDRLVDVLREPYDLAIRAGNPGDGDAIARKIANLSM